MFWTAVLESILLVFAVTTDAFVASFAYGTNRIKIPLVSVAIITLVCTFILGVSLMVGALVRPFVPVVVTKAVCFVILLILGLSKLFDSTIKSLIRKHKDLSKEVSFSAFNLNFILCIYADPEDADQDRSRRLSPVEALSLAFALSIDGLAVGFGAALAAVNCLYVICVSLILHMCVLMLGSFLGNQVAKKAPLNLSWLSGVILIVLAFFKL